MGGEGNGEREGNGPQRESPHCRQYLVVIPSPYILPLVVSSHGDEDSPGIVPCLIILIHTRAHME